MCYISLQIDESKDVIDISQLTIFVRTIFSDFSAIDDFLKVNQIKEYTMGKDIYSETNKMSSSENIPV